MEINIYKYIINDNINKRFLTFISIGVIDTFLDIGLFTFLISTFGRSSEKIVILNLISFSTIVLLSFYLNGKFTFKDKNLTKKKLIKYYASSSFGMFLNTLIVTLLMINFGLGTIISKIISACVVVFYNYIMSKKYIFGESK